MKRIFGLLLAWMMSLVAVLPAGAADFASSPMRTESGIAYVSGGLGLDGREAMAAVASDYNLKLVFAAKKSGAYLADVQVSIVNAKNQVVLEAVSKGPWFLAALPAGHYKVSAAYKGQNLMQKASVKTGRQTQRYFYWHVDEASLATPDGMGGSTVQSKRTDSGIAYVSGGLGLDGREAMAAATHDYTLKLVFAAQGSGAYLANVRVAIVDAKNRTMLEAVSNGPWFFARLPAGHYKITATYKGQNQTQAADISVGRQTQQHFYWQVENGNHAAPNAPASTQ